MYIFDILIQRGRNIPNQRRIFDAVYRYGVLFLFCDFTYHHSELKSRISFGKEPIFSLQYEKDIKLILIINLKTRINIMICQDIFDFRNLDEFWPALVIFGIFFNLQQNGQFFEIHQYFQCLGIIKKWGLFFLKYFGLNIFILVHCDYQGLQLAKCVVKLFS